MKYGDLSSIVQLGVGLHVGTAVFQLYGELGLAPMERRLNGIRSLFQLPAEQRPSPPLLDELTILEGRYTLFKVSFFQRYRWCVIADSAVAAILALLLVIIACKAEDVISEGFTWFIVLAVGLSFLPAPLMLGGLWCDARRRVAPLKKVADDLEERATVGADRRGS